MPNHNAAVPAPELLDKEMKVLELRRMGFTWQKIAEQVGYADHTGAYSAYKRALKRTLQQPADELREQEGDRIDRLMLAAWPNAMKGNERAILAIVKLMERRAKLFGLDAPTRVQAEVVNYDGEQLRASAERVVSIIKQHSIEESGMGSDTGKTGADS